MNIKKQLFLIVIIILTVSCNKYNIKVDELFSHWDTKTAPGCAIAVLKNGKTIYKKGFGMANLENQVSMTSKTRFNFGSISKQFTGYSILLLESKGLLSIEDDIRLYLPEIPDFGFVIKVSDLMYHISGLREEFDLIALSGNIEKDRYGKFRFKKPIYTEDIIELVSKQKKLNVNEPGKLFTYNNTGYTLLAEIVTRVSGQNFVDFTKREIFNELGMENSGFTDKRDRDIEAKIRSYYYNYDIENYVINDNTHFAPGAGELYSTIDDMVIWINFLQNGLEKKDELITKMLTPGQEFYASGIIVGSYQGQKTFGHSGLISSFRSEMFFIPDSGLTYIMISNNDDISPLDYTTKIIDILINKDLTVEKTLFEEIVVKQDILEHYTKSYHLEEFGMILDFTIKNSVLFINETTPLVPIKENIFYTPSYNIKFTFQNRKDRNPLLFVEYYGQTFKTKIVNSNNKKSLQRFIGTYYSNELDAQLIIEFQGDNLIVRNKSGNTTRLVHFYGNKLYGDAYYIAYIDFNKSLTGFSVSSASGESNILSRRSRNIEFVKMD